MPWEALPEGVGANPLIKRLKAMDAEIYGTLYAHTGTLGDLQLDGDLDVAGDIILTSGGAFRSTEFAGVSSEGIVISYSNRNRIEFYTDDDAELYVSRIVNDMVGTGSATTDYIRMDIEVGGFDVSSFPGAEIVMKSPTRDDSTGDGAVYLATRSAGGASPTNRFVVDGVRADTSGNTFLKLPVKTTTGDPSSPTNGDMYVNTSDNKIRVYADSAWHDLATW